jgi:hypothetical protein
MKRSFELHFFQTQDGCGLHETKFISADGQIVRCFRGRTAGAFRGAGTFHWSSGVRAAAALSLRHILSDKNPIIDRYLSGSQASLAASLDYALSKHPAWLLDMFGVQKNGLLIAKRLFLVTNPNQKRPGPVAVAINEFSLAPSDIRVFYNGHQAVDFVELLNILRAIEPTFPQDLYESACGMIKLAS